MDQINQVPTGGTPEPKQPAQTPAQPAKASTPLAQAQTPSPTPPAQEPTSLAQLPSFAPKKSNVKLWAGVIGGILIVVIGAAMILGKTKTYKGSITQEELEADRLAQQKPSEITETPPPAETPPEQLPILVEPTPIEMPAKAAPANEGLIALCNSLSEAVWNPGHAKCSFNGQNYGDEFSLSAAYETSKPQTNEIQTEEQKEAARLATQKAETQTKTTETAATETHPTGPTGVETKIDETSQHSLVAQAEMDVLKGLCDSTAGARWNEAGDDSGCVFEEINFKNLQAFKTKVDQVSKQAQASGSKPLGAASDESQAIATIAKIDNAARNAAEDAEYVASLLKKYPSNTEIQSANAKAQNAAATAQDALGFAKDETDLGILDTLLGKAELAASKASDAKNAALKAADEEDAKKQVVLSEPEPEPEFDLDEFSAEEEIADLKAEIENLKNQLADAKNDNDKTLINQLIAEIAALNAKIASLGGQPVNVTVNVPEYKSAAPESACADPSFVYDPFKKKCIAPTEVGASGGGSGGGGGTKSVSSAEGKKGAMEMPEMWNDEVKTKTIETPEMWGDVTPTSKKSTGAAKTGSSYGATIQGKTGPGVLLYPVFIAGANSLYYLLRKRRK